MIAVFAEFLEQYVQAFGFRNEGGFTHNILDVKALGIAAFQQQGNEVLGQQDTDDIVTVFTTYRKTGMSATGNNLQNFLQAIPGAQGSDLGPRNHDFPYLHITDLQCAFNNAQRFSVDNLRLMGKAHLFYQTPLICWLIAEKCFDFIDPGQLSRIVA